MLFQIGKPLNLFHFLFNSLKFFIILSLVIEIDMPSFNYQADLSAKQLMNVFDKLG